MVGHLTRATQVPPDRVIVDITHFDGYLAESSRISATLSLQDIFDLLPSHGSNANKTIPYLFVTKGGLAAATCDTLFVSLPPAPRVVEKPQQTAGPDSHPIVNRFHADPES
jgi:hypothetical protein